MTARIDAVLFDLDGTLADTAPDLAAAANALRARRGLPALPLEELRPWASQGARGLLGAAFAIKPADPAYKAMAEEFLLEYERSLAVRSKLFDGMPELLSTLERLGIRWGIVTNKAARFTEPLVDALGLSRRAGAVVSGDTTPHAKPHPAPLLHAAHAMAITPSACVYVGDDERDIIAGRAADMRTVAAAYGYCAKGEPARWGADALIDSPSGLLQVLARWS